MKIKYTLLTLATALALTSCGKEESAQQSGSTSGAAAIESIIITKAPANALSIVEVRQAIEIGKEVTMAGKVMGRMDPFIDGRALAVLGDPAAITSCDLRSCDSCATPWDVCCDDVDAIKASTATIQIVDADGRPLKQGLKGISGIKELSNIIVKGTIAEGSNADNLLVNVTAIFVQ